MIPWAPPDVWLWSVHLLLWAAGHHSSGLACLRNLLLAVLWSTSPFATLVSPSSVITILYFFLDFICKWDHTIVFFLVSGLFHLASYPMDTLIWQMARLHCFWEPNNYKLPFPCPFMLLSVMLQLHRARDADTEKWLYSLPVYSWRGIADSMWRSLSPEPLVEEAVFSPLPVNGLIRSVKWLQVVLEYEPQAPQGRELTSESCPLISALLPPPLSHIHQLTICA